MLKFEIVSSRIVEGQENEKKYVAYLIKVRQDNEESEDPDPVHVERRYTQFLDLYNGLKKDFPSLLSNISFPRKTMMGNFDPALISTRCSAFEALLETISSESRLRESPAAATFFRDAELTEARRLMNEKDYSQGVFELITSFKLLNKVYTDRSRVVLSALCRIVACAAATGEALALEGERWAQLALRRYEAVSDSDLLLIYVPLLYSCISIWETLGRDKSKLEQELNDLRKRGMKVDSTLTLLEAVDSLDISI